MPKYHMIKVDFKTLQYATDMLRYDSAFEINKVRDHKLQVEDEAKLQTVQYEIKLVNFTEARWRSFGVSIDSLNMVTMNCTAKEREEQYLKSEGLIRGIRFAQDFTYRFQNTEFSHNLVEGTI